MEGLQLEALKEFITSLKEFLRLERESSRCCGISNGWSNEQAREMANEVSADNEPTEREMDVLLSTGEQTTIALTSMAINALGGKQYL